MYGIDGRECLPEDELTHLEGYMGSAPVRIGNGAATQLQLDIYGELMDSVYLCNKYGLPIYHDGWMELTRNLEWAIAPSQCSPRLKTLRRWGTDPVDRMETVRVGWHWVSAGRFYWALVDVTILPAPSGRSADGTYFRPDCVGWSGADLPCLCLRR